MTQDQHDPAPAATGAPSGPGGFRGARLAKNSIWNTAGWLGVLAVGIVSLPVITRLLGEVQYGLMAILTSIIAPLGILEFGMGEATVKYVAESIGRNDMEQAKRYIASTLSFNVLVGCAGWLVLVLLADSIVALFKIPESSQTLARACLLWVGGTWCINQVRQTFVGVITAAQRYDVLSIATALTQIIGIGAGLVALVLGGDLLSYIRTQTLAMLCVAVAWVITAQRVFPHMRLALRPDWVSFRRTFRFGFWQMLNNLGGIISYQSQRWLLAALLPVSAVGFYDIGGRVVNMVYMASYKVGQVLFPEVSRMQGEQQEERAARIVVSATSTMAVLSVTLFVPLVVFANDLLRLYVGESFALHSSPILRILAIGTTMGCMFAAPSFYLLGTGRTRWLAAMSITYGAVTLGMCALLIPMIGITGASWAMAVGTLVHGTVLILLWTRVLRAWIPGPVYAAAIFAPFCIGVLLGVGGIMLRALVSWTPGWIELAAAGGATALAAFAVTSAIDGMLPGGRERRELLLRLLHKGKDAMLRRLLKDHA